jgi:hypothetical protein
MLGIGTQQDANVTRKWASWLMRGGTYTNPNQAAEEQPAPAPAPALSPLDLDTATEQQQPRSERPQFFPLPQEVIREDLKYADATRLRFWVRLLREEVIREAGYNNHQSLLISQLRALTDVQQRELATARVTLRKMAGQLERSKIVEASFVNMNEINHSALRMAGKSRLNAQDDREALLGELDRLKLENATLKKRLNEHR